MLHASHIIVALRAATDWSDRPAVGCVGVIGAMGRGRSFPVASKNWLGRYETLKPE